MTFSNEEADKIAEAMLEGADPDTFRMMWIIAKDLGRIGASPHELDRLIAVLMFGNAALRCRESLNILELWECENGPCPDCCEDCANATGGYCRKHVPPWEYDRGGGY